MSAKVVTVAIEMFNKASTPATVVLAVWATIVSVSVKNSRQTERLERKVDAQLTELYELKRSSVEATSRADKTQAKIDAILDALHSVPGFQERFESIK